MTITTSKPKTYQVLWVDTSPTNEKVLTLQMADSRRLTEIAPEFDGLTKISRQDENQGDKEFTGYTRLVGIKRIGDDVLIQMEATQ